MQNHDVHVVVDHSGGLIGITKSTQWAFPFTYRTSRSLYSLLFVFLTNTAAASDEQTRLSLPSSLLESVAKFHVPRQEIEENWDTFQPIKLSSIEELGRDRGGIESESFNRSFRVRQPIVKEFLDVAQISAVSAWLLTTTLGKCSSQEGGGRAAAEMGFGCVWMKVVPTFRWEN